MGNNHDDDDELDPSAFSPGATKSVAKENKKHKGAQHKHIAVRRKQKKMKPCS